jgi:hypothetical protein
VQTLVAHQASITLKDLIGSKFSGFDLERQIGVFLGDEHTALPPTSREKIYPIIVGEISDHGATAMTTVGPINAEKGLLPVIDTGQYDVVNPGTPPTYSAPPVITSATVVGAGGSETYQYAASIVTPYGESVMGNIVTVSGAPAPAQMSLSNYVQLEGTYDPGVNQTNAVRILGRSNPSAQWLDLANFHDPGTGTWGYLDGAANYPSPTRDELDIEKPWMGGGNPLNSNDVWGHLLVCLGEFLVDDIFWSDLNDQAEPKRVLADPSLEGIEWMTAQSPQWPYPGPTITRTNPVTGESFEATYILVRGHRYDAHINGDVTIAVNGAMADLVAQAFRAGARFINEHILKDKGTGYRTGSFGTLETFVNGDAQIWTSAWEAAQTLSATRIGGEGYLGDWTVHEPITVREWVQRFCLSFDCRLAVNQHGQIFPILIDDLADPAAGRAYREFVDGMDLLEQPLAHEEIENRIPYAYDFDPDGNALRVTGQFVESASSIAAHVPGGVVGNPNPRGVHETDIQELVYCRDPETALDSRARRLNRNKKAPRYVRHAQDFRALENDLGSQVRVTHRDGKGASGDTDTPLCVLEHIVHCSYGAMGTELVGMDIERIAVNGPLVLPLTLGPTVVLT